MRTNQRIALIQEVLGTGPIRTDKTTIPERIERIRQIIEANPPEPVTPPRAQQPAVKKKPVGAKELQARRHHLFAIAARKQS